MGFAHLSTVSICLNGMRMRYMLSLPGAPVLLLQYNVKQGLLVESAACHLATSPCNFNHFSSWNFS
jgi:hypothetical protein